MSKYYYFIGMKIGDAIRILGFHWNCEQTELADGKMQMVFSYKDETITFITQLYNNEYFVIVDVK